MHTLTTNVFVRRFVSIIILIALLLQISPVHSIEINNSDEIENNEQSTTVYEQLILTQNLNEFWDIMMAEENRNDVLSLMMTEIQELKNKVYSLYDAIDTPSSGDIETKDVLLETLASLPAMECAECGQFDSHADDCSKNMQILVSNPTDGMTLTENASIGKQTLNGGTTITWNIPSGITLTITGTILLQNNTKLVITGGGTIIRNTSSTLFDIEDTCTLNLDGITVDGKGNTFNYPLAQTTADDKVSNIVINNTTITGINMNSSIGRGVITVFTNSSKKGSKCNITITNSVFENCSAVTGAALYFQDNVKSNVTISNTIFRNNTTSQGGVIRTSGNSGVTLTLNQCVFKNNTAKDTLFSNKVASYTNGAAIYWNACGTDLNGNRSAIIIQDCQFLSNVVTYGGSSVEDGCGGAIYNEAFMTITSNATSNYTLTETTPGNIRGNLIFGNSASNMGGGIMIPTYSGGMSAHEGYGATLELDDSVFVIDNTANKGGGIAMSVGLGSVGGSNPETSGVEYIITCNGATIQNNTAYEMGGGIYLEREAGKDYFPSTVDLLSGVISNNTAPKGGALCVYNASATASTKRNEVNIGSTNGNLIISNNSSTISGGAIYIYYGNASMNNGDLNTNNAPSGGAISIENGQFEMSGGNITNCVATNNGGAVSLLGGNFTMSNGSIIDCSAQTGGAIFIEQGNVNMYNGILRSNNANNGGAIYIEGGNINMYNGVIDNNTASNNGGAIYAISNSQNIVINIYDGEITNNSAGKHAGAIGANVTGTYSATINIGLEACKAIDKTKHDDSACPILKNNTASISGGAICLHSESNNLVVNIYCGHITDNIAIRYEGTNNINQEGGILTIFGGEIGAGISVGSGTYNDKRPGASEKNLIIRLWANYNGGPSTPVLIDCTLGVMLNLPGNVYYREGKTLSGWTMVPNEQSGWSPVGGSFVVYETEDGYMDLYAVWDATVSYIVYIPDTVEINNEGVGSMEISADLVFFKANSTLNVYIDTDLKLTCVANSLDVLNYQIRTSEKGITDAINRGDLAASFQYDNTVPKTLTLTVLDKPKYANQYQGLITFIIDYQEIEED